MLFAKTVVFASYDLGRSASAFTSPSSCCGGGTRYMSTLGNYCVPLGDLCGCRVVVTARNYASLTCYGSKARSTRLSVAPTGPHFKTSI